MFHCAIRLAAAIGALALCAPACAQPIVPSDKQVSGVAVMCRKAADRFIVDWGPGFSTWVIDKCELSADERQLGLSIQDTLSQRSGVIVFELIGAGFYRGQFRTEVSPGSQGFYTGQATLRFRADGVGSGQWQMFGGLFVNSDGPLTVKPAP